MIIWHADLDRHPTLGRDWIALATLPSTASSSLNFGIGIAQGASFYSIESSEQTQFLALKRHYVTIPLAGWWLWPDIIRRESLYLIAVIASTILPPVLGYCKFRTSTSYHTWAAKGAALLVGSGVILLFAGWSPWPFRLATPLYAYAALEEIAITLVLPKHQSNVRSLWHIAREPGVHADRER